MRWDTVLLGDIALLKGGSVDPKKHQDEVFELYSIPAFDAGAPEVVRGSEIGSSKKAVQPRDVMISRIVPHIRRACVVGESNGQRKIASGEWIIFRSNRVWPPYLRWVLVGDAFHSAFMQTVAGVGGSLLRARPAEVFRIRVPVPPLAEQKRIAAILDAADALRAKRRESLVELDKLVQSVFLDMFGDPVTNPMGWRQVPFVKIGRFVSGGTPSKSRPEFWDGEIPWVSPKDMKVTRIVGSIDHVTRNALDETSLKLLTPGHLLVVVRGMILAHSFPVGANTVPVTINQDMKAIALSDDFDLSFMLECARHLKRQVVEEVSTAGHGTRRFDVEAMRRIQVPVPPLDSQTRFATVAHSIGDQAGRQSAHLEQLDALFASLQSRAFSGEL